MIISSAGAEGISLTGVRQVHIMEPYWNVSRLDQVIGRAVRYCSHKDVIKSKHQSSVSEKLGLVIILLPDFSLQAIIINKK